MDMSAISQLVGVVGTVVGTGGAVWSRRAARLSGPTGNGFAASVLTSLVRIESRLDTVESRLDNLAASDHHV